MDAAAIPAFDATGNLPPGIYRATLDAIQARFCTGEVRAHWGQVLREVVALVQSTERVETMYIFGSFVTAKAAPADLDLFVSSWRPTLRVSAWKGGRGCYSTAVGPPWCGASVSTG